MPVAAYSLDIGKAHTDFAEGKMQMRLIERQLEDEEIDAFAIISMAGVASEATRYEEVLSSSSAFSSLYWISSDLEPMNASASSQEVKLLLAVLQLG